MNSLRPRPFFLIALLLVGFFAATAQQALEAISLNPHVRYLYEIAQENQQNAKLKSAGIDTINVNVSTNRVIFMDDFSDYGGWPKAELWQDNEVFVNYSLGWNPVSKGVASFDGLDETGYPYNFFDQFAYGENDHLTSCPMRMGSVDINNPNVDSVYLSFYYQPQGMNPFGTEEGDSLMLEFYNPSTSKWTQVWGADGEEIYAFKRAVLLVDTAYHKDGFQFRFTNFGNQVGSVDHWHIDYVYMTSNKLIDHLNPEDMAIRHRQFTLLKDYTAMPWWHYKTTQMREEVDLDYYYFNRKKLKSGDLKSWLEISDAEGTQLILTNTASPEFVIGFLGGKRVNWGFNSTGTISFPTSTSEVVNFFNYKFYYSFNNFAADSNSANDTLKEQQLFGSYYAYDDGTAEAGYGVFGSGNELAYAFDMGTNVDTLRACNIYFNPIIHDRSKDRFRLVVWSEKNGKPDKELLVNTRVDRPKYSEFNRFKGIANFVRYELDVPLVLTGKFFIGWVKLTDDRLNVGYDVNRDYQNKIFVNIGSGWLKSDSSGGVVPGALMIRPAFRDLIDPVLSTDEQAAEKRRVQVFPNPTSGQFTVTNNFYSGELHDLEIIDIRGKTVHRTVYGEKTTIDLNGMAPGFYLLRTYDRRNNDFIINKLLIE
jgi:hypothetical protein